MHPRAESRRRQPFRLYVEQLAQRGRISARERELIHAIAVGEPSGQGVTFRGVLREASQILSSVSKHAALVLMPTLDNVIFAKIEFMPDSRYGRTCGLYCAKRLYSASGPRGRRRAGARRTDPDVQLPKLDVDRENARRRSTRYCAGDGQRAGTSRQYDAASPIARRATLRATGGHDMLLEGERTFLDHPEFADIAKMRKLLRAFEEKTVLLHLLDVASIAPVEATAATFAETAVLFGADSAVRDLRDLAAVTARYSSSDGPGGQVAVVGPTRMNYARVIPLVELTAHALSKTLGTHAGSDEPPVSTTSDKSVRNDNS